MSLRNQIETALTRLIGEPMWAAGRAARIVWFQFGPELPTVDYRGRPKVVGSHALHVDCPWRWLEAWGNVRADDHFLHAELAILGQTRVACQTVSADERGGFRISFDDGSVLIVEPEENAEEYWRLLEPAQDTPHFVVGADGVEE